MRLALATIGAVERPGRGGADGTRLLLAQPFQIVLGRRRFLPPRLRVLCQPIPRPPLLGDNDFALSLDELSDLRKSIAQIAERCGGRHSVRQVCLTLCSRVNWAYPSVWPYEKGSREFAIPLGLTENFVA